MLTGFSAFPWTLNLWVQKFMLRLTHGLNQGMSLRGQLQLDPSFSILQMFTERPLLPRSPIPAKCPLGSSEP